MGTGPDGGPRATRYPLGMKDLSIEPCPIPDPPIDAGGRCALCKERVHDTASGDRSSAERLARRGACGRVLRDGAGRLLFATWLLTTGAEAAAHTLRLEVVDAETGEPLPAAVLTSPDLDDRIRVDPASGTWQGDSLGTAEGAVPFARGTILSLEISAPGYLNQEVSIRIRRRHQRLEVALERLVLDLDADLEDPIITFGRMKPID